MFLVVGVCFLATPKISTASTTVSISTGMLGFVLGNAVAAPLKEEKQCNCWLPYSFSTGIQNYSARTVFFNLYSILIEMACWRHVHTQTFIIIKHFYLSLDGSTECTLYNISQYAVQCTTYCEIYSLLIPIPR